MCGIATATLGKKALTMFLGYSGGELDLAGALYCPNELGWKISGELERDTEPNPVTRRELKAKLLTFKKDQLAEAILELCENAKEA